jgi:signal transduction histidine kinase
MNEVAPHAAKRWSVQRWAGVLALVEAIMVVAAISGGVIALSNLGEARSQLIDHTDPQLVQASELSTALLNQETGARGYLLNPRPDFLEPFTLGKQQEVAAVAEMRRLGATPGTEEGRDLEEVENRARSWQQTADARVASGLPAQTTADADQGKVQFDAVRAALATQRAHLEQARATATSSLLAADRFLRIMLAVIAVLVLALFVILYWGFRRTIAGPIAKLAAEVRAVSSEDIHLHVQGGGPRELVELASDIEGMRQRIVDEVSQLHRAHELLDTRTQELQRSNSDLEQFAYVASHDLQEPLRKVASFCQLLQRRYQGQLDERGDQYIQFAVDGAKRMQALINDLLSFSRVGRRAGEHVVVDTGQLFDTAIGNLEPVIAETGAQVTHGELPLVRGEASLLTAVLQNLVNNAVKFRGESTPEVRVDARRDSDEWLFSVTDNGIGIETEYAERIFVIFQRLHAKSAYPGTGIGLAMSRKIIEYHGGRIWLDKEAPEGRTRFYFTLPAITDAPEPETVEPQPGTPGTEPTVQSTADRVEIQAAETEKEDA